MTYELEEAILSKTVKLGEAYSGPPLVPRLPGESIYKCVRVGVDDCYTFEARFDGIAVGKVVIGIIEGRLEYYIPRKKEASGP